MKITSKSIVFSSILGLFILGLVECASAWMIHVLRERGGMAYIPHFSSDQASRILSNLDPRFGWGPEPVSKLKKYMNPREDSIFSKNQTSLVSVYGDSFTYGGKRDETYPHYLSLDLKCPVANYGVGGYGSDQALMLFRNQKGFDKAPIVILGHLSENILRNVNQYRNLLYPGSKDQFKPRFILQQNELHWVPLPIENLSDFKRLEKSPGAVLREEAFIDRPRPFFPYFVSLLRWLIFDYHFHSKLLGKARYAPFYKRDHPRGALPLTARILESFAQEAREENRIPYVLLIPTGADLISAQKTGVWVDQPLKEILLEKGVRVIPAGPAILARIQGEDPCQLFESCNAHFNARGYQMLAKIVSEAIQEEVKKHV
ncbi:MAG: SGNH/GDSL hydrolase family protein [Chlamydiae bacterium]|nr:SGNH/GDSL hydrolase family protein [Chlamydiota bacterium]